MTNFIQLTHEPTGKSLMLNVGSIESIFNNGTDPSGINCMGDVNAGFYMVKESYHAIMVLLAKLPNVEVVS